MQVASALKSGTGLNNSLKSKFHEKNGPLDDSLSKLFDKVSELPTKGDLAVLLTKDDLALLAMLPTKDDIAVLPTKDDLATKVSELSTELTSKISGLSAELASTKLEVVILSCKLDNVGIMKHNASDFTTSAKLKAPKKTVKGLLDVSRYIHSSANGKEIFTPEKNPEIGDCHPLLVGANWARVNKFTHAEIISIMQWYNEDMHIATEDDINIRGVKVRSWLTGADDGNAAPGHGSVIVAEHEVDSI